MQEVLIRKFHAYLKENCPDLLDSLGGQEAITAFVQRQVLAQEPVIDQLVDDEAPPFIIEEILMESLKELCNERSSDGL